VYLFGPACFHLAGGGGTVGGGPPGGGFGIPGGKGTIGGQIVPHCNNALQFFRTSHMASYIADGAV
jgi:hypothetical protein